MMLEWSILAVQDRDEIFDYLERQSPFIASQIDLRIEAKIDLLALTPEMGRPGRVPGTRELVIERTPFIAAYIVQANAVRVLRILHGAQLWPAGL